MKLLPLVWLAVIYPLTSGEVTAGQGKGPKAPPSRKAQTDRFGDPLPPGATARLGLLRYASGGYGVPLAVCLALNLVASAVVLRRPPPHKIDLSSGT